MTTRSIVGALVLAGLATVAGCRRLPPAQPTPAEAAAEPPGRTEAESAADPRETASRDDGRPISARAQAIIDSIEAAVADSFAALRAAEASARARADSIAEAARRDSIAALARADSIARAQAVQDSIADARRDSIAAAEAAALEAARRDSIAEAARQDSIVSARADSIAAAIRRDSLDAAMRRDSLEAAMRADSIRAAEAAEQAAARESAVPDDLETLRGLGPSYIPYDRGPETIWDTETRATLSLSLLPVLRAESLPASTKAIFWVLISREGVPVETRIQTSSGNESFDDAARAFLEGLRFLPAIRANRPVPSWVLREISILMQR